MRLALCLALSLWAAGASHAATQFAVVTEPAVLEERNIWDFTADSSEDAYINILPPDGIHIRRDVFIDQLPLLFTGLDVCDNLYEGTDGCDMTFGNRVVNILRTDSLAKTGALCCTERDVTPASAASCNTSNLSAGCARIRIRLYRDAAFDISEPEAVALTPRLLAPATYVVANSSVSMAAVADLSFTINPSQGLLSVDFVDVTQELARRQTLPSLADCMIPKTNTLNMSAAAVAAATTLSETPSYFVINLRGEMFKFDVSEPSQPEFQNTLYSHVNADVCCGTTCYSVSDTAECLEGFNPSTHALWTAGQGVPFFPSQVTFTPPYTIKIELTGNGSPFYLPDSTYSLLFRFFKNANTTGKLSKSGLPFAPATTDKVLLARSPFMQCGEGSLVGWDPANGCKHCKPGYGGPMCDDLCPGYTGDGDLGDICSGNADCPKDVDDMRCTYGCLDGLGVPPSCACEPGREGYNCGDRTALQAAANTVTTLSAFSILLYAAVSGSFAAPVTTITQLQFIVMLGLQTEAPANVRALSSGMPWVMNPAYGSLPREEDKDRDAKHLLHSYVLLAGAAGLHLAVVSVVWMWRRSRGWLFWDAAEFVFFPNLLVLVGILLLSNSVESSSGIVASPHAHHAGVVIAAYFMLLFYGVGVPVTVCLFLRRAFLARSPKTQYISRNVANTTHNALAVVHTNKRVTQMPRLLVYFLPWGFWSSHHLPDRRFCRRWDVLYDEFRGRHSGFMLANLLKFLAYALVLGARKGATLQAFKAKIAVLLACCCAYLLYLGRACPYSSRGSNLLHITVAVLNVGAALSILLDLMGFGDTNAHIFLVISTAVLILNYVWNILVLVLGRTLYTVKHVAAPPAECGDSAGESNAVLSQRLRNAHWTAAEVPGPELDSLLRRMTGLCGNIDLCLRRSDGGAFGRAFPQCGLFTSSALCGPKFRQHCWAEVRVDESDRVAQLLYYESASDSAPLGGIDLSLCSLVLAKNRCVKIVVCATSEVFLVRGSTEAESKLWYHTLERYSSRSSIRNTEGPVLTESLPTSYENVAQIGEGSFGVVSHVRDKDGGDFAMKTLSPSSEVERQTIMNEISVLQLIQHPFIVRLHEAGEADRRVFLVLQYLQGGDLERHLREKGTLPMDHTRFYMAQVVLALEHLHENNILYRDLKPSNIVLDKVGRGNAVLTDMGVAAVSKGLVSASLCGTPLYLAPEMLPPEVQAYTQAVDWWATGIVTYELLKGVTPFAAAEPQAVYALIRMRHAVRFDDGDAPATREFVEALLRKDPEKRLRKPKQIKAREFFKGLDFEKLLRGQLEPPALEPLAEKTPRASPQPVAPVKVPTAVTASTSPVRFAGSLVPRRPSDGGTLAKTCSAQTETTSCSSPVPSSVSRPPFSFPDLNASPTDVQQAAHLDTPPATTTNPIETLFSNPKASLMSSSGGSLCSSSPQPRSQDAQAKAGRQFSALSLDQVSFNDEARKTVSSVVTTSLQLADGSRPPEAPQEANPLTKPRDAPSVASPDS
eukprot:Rhum_TRINITY_DN8372_c0_g1::Rhum_TRINITY_DN8372_c0_g1_i1::g.27597::m.27597